jgi:hypothetical protein
VFAGYPVDELVRGSRDVGSICRSRREVIAVEPDATNVAFLRAQTFADTLEIHQAAVGPFDGTARLIR